MKAAVKGTAFVLGSALLLSACGSSASSRDVDACRAVLATSQDVIRMGELDPPRVEGYQLVGGTSILQPTSILIAQTKGYDGGLDDRVLQANADRITATGQAFYERASRGIDATGALDAMTPYIEAVEEMLATCKSIV